MGKIRSDMEKLVNQVRTAASARHGGIHQMRKGARELLDRDHGERRERAQTLAESAHALSAMLERQTRSRREATSGMKGALGRIGECRKTAIRQARSQMCHRLQQLHLGRERTALELKRSVQGEVGDIRQTVSALRSTVRATMANIAADVREARRLWSSGPSKIPARRQ